jgi:hypothetical protein
LMSPDRDVIGSGETGLFNGWAFFVS